MKRISRLLGFTFLLAGFLPAQAEDYPQRPVTIIASTAPGGSVDTISRILAAAFTERWKQTVVVENKLGASGTIGAGAVAASKPDGHTLLLAYSGPIGSMEILRPQTPYRALKDFRPIGVIGAAPLMLWLRKDLGINTVSQMVTYAKASPGKLTFATGGAGSTSHLAMELLKSSAGIEMRHIPMPNSGQAMAALIGGHIDGMAIGAVGHYEPLEASGRTTKITVFGRERFPGAKDVPTIHETEVKGVDIEGWFGLMAPAATPNAVVDKIEADLLAVLAMPDVRAKLEAAGAILRPGNRATLAAMVKSDLELVQKISSSKNFSLQ